MYFNLIKCPTGEFKDLANLAVNSFSIKGYTKMK
jgi:hypothetical protein